MRYAEYHAKCFAECSSSKDIQLEIDRLKILWNYDWMTTGNATLDYIRQTTLENILKERYHENP